MEILIYIAILGYLAFETQSLSAEFRGANESMKLALITTAAIGFVSFFGFSIWSMFIVTWWHTLIMVAIIAFGSGIVSGFIKIIHSSNVYIHIIWLFLCIIATWVFAVISLIKLIK